MTPGRPAAVIRAIVSDVDGTLVTPKKLLTERAMAAVAKLRQSGISFTLISSRPPRGMRMLLDPLQISEPIAAFNGGIIVSPALDIIAEHLISETVARSVLAMFTSREIQAWVFDGQAWFVRDGSAPYVAHEQLTVGFAPTVVENFAPFLDRAAKIVGVSADRSALGGCERALRLALGEAATITCSQPYYLDITHPLANKGDALAALATHLGVALHEIAVIGDGQNDVPMFLRGGSSIAMGNASDEVKAKASEVTASNDDEGFAKAIEQFVLPRATPQSGR